MATNTLWSTVLDPSNSPSLPWWSQPAIDFGSEPDMFLPTYSWMQVSKTGCVICSPICNPNIILDGIHNNTYVGVGTLLAAIANSIAEGLRILSLADKRQWGQDEHEQVHALEVVQDQARRDFQELSPLVNGQAQYEHDRTR